MKSSTVEDVAELLELLGKVSGNRENDKKRDLGETHDVAHMGSTETSQSRLKMVRLKHCKIRQS